MTDQSYPMTGMILLSTALLSGCVVDQYKQTYQGTDVTNLAKMNANGHAWIDLKSGGVKLLFYPVAKVGDCFCDTDTCIREDAIESVKVTQVENGVSIVAAPAGAALMAVCVVDGGRDNYGLCPPIGASRQNKGPSELSTLPGEPLAASYCPSDGEVYQAPDDNS